MQRRKEEREKTGKRNARPKRTTLTSPSTPSSSKGNAGSFRKFQKFNASQKLTSRNYFAGTSDSESDDFEADDGSLELMYENRLMNSTGVKQENQVVSSSSSFFCCSSSLEVDSPQHFESDVSICLRRIDHFARLQRASVLRSSVVKPNFAEQISATSIQNIATESIFTELSSVTMPVPAPNNCPKPNCGRALDGLDVQDGNTIFCHLCRFPHCTACGHCRLPDEWQMLWRQVDEIH